MPRNCPSLTGFPTVSVHSLAEWPKHRVDSVCKSAYRTYEAELTCKHERYFAERPHLKARGHPYSASSLAAALPPGRAELLSLIPPRAFHTHARSAKSSQMLTLSLLGSAQMEEPSAAWFWSATGIPKCSPSATPTVRFEHRLSPSDLGEEPNTTQLDVSIETETCFVAVEAKLTESGLSPCSCPARNEGTPLAGGMCADRVVFRRRYWEAAEEFFGLPYDRLPLLACPISPIYQILRNIAAAKRLAGPRRSFAFVLLYDTRNPYFSGVERWPGWPAILQPHLTGRECRGFYFRAISWQTLVPQLPLDRETRIWAADKHGIS